ncbi:hypothetical protein GBA52_024140 [Prunus armeniaca]|nr:hypothetical protein GBA52_024140 [Prunus armeniaca]
MVAEGGLVEEIYRLRHQRFHFSVKYIPQCANTVAHRIAQHSRVPSKNRSSMAPIVRFMT